MKREFLKGLGLEKEVIDKIMDENGTDVTVHNKALADQKLKYDGELKIANDTITGMKDTVKKFDGVDLVALNKQISDGETKYTTDMAKIKRDSALTLALTTSKAKNAKAIMALLDQDTIKLDGDKLLGLDAQLEALKASDAYLFNLEDKGAPPAPQNPAFNLNSGVEHGGAPNTEESSMKDALTQHYKK